MEPGFGSRCKKGLQLRRRSSPCPNPLFRNCLGQGATSSPLLFVKGLVTSATKQILLWQRANQEVFSPKGMEKKPRNCGTFPRTESWQSLDTVCHSVSRFLTDVHLCPATPRCLSFSGDSKYDVCLDATEDKHCLGVKHRLENTKDNQPTCTSSIYRL